MAEYRVFKSRGDTGAAAGVWSQDDGTYQLRVSNQAGEEVHISCSEHEAQSQMNMALSDPDWYIKNRRLK